MKLLITGGAGFIGSNFVRYWVENHPEDQITVLDKLTYAGNLENLEPVLEKIQFIKGDICDAKTVEAAVKNCDTIVHFAAESHVDRSILDPGQFMQTNVIGTFTLLEAARTNGMKRFHHVSTDEVFGSIPLEDDKKFTEQTPYDPRSPYAASKAASDHLVNAYFHTYNLPITITNCSNNFGPYMFPEKLIPLAITNVLEGKKIPIYKPGNQVRDWLYVEDHCRAIDMVLTEGKIGETYLVGGLHREFTNLEVAKMITTLMHVPESTIEIVGDRPGHDVKYAVDPSKIMNELGWAPEHSFEEYLSATIRWYTDNQDYWKKIKSGEYQNYYEANYNHKKSSNNN